MRRFRSPREPLCRWYAHRVMQHLCTANREWLATTLLSTTESHSDTAFLAIRDALMRAPEPVTLVAIGPLTNIALLLLQCPECKPYIRRLVIMGGSAGRGNCTPNAEFNIAANPEAAACVFRSGIEIVMCGLDVTNQAILTPDYLATLPELNRTGKMLHALFSHYRSGSMQSGLRMHNLCAIAWLVRRTYSPSSRVLSR